MCLALTTSLQMPCHTISPALHSHHCPASILTSFNPLAKHWACRVDVTDPTKPRQPPQVAWSWEHLFRECAVTLGHALDNSTLTTNGSHLQSYLTFCKLHNFPLEPLPDSLSFYIVFMCHHIKSNSILQFLLGIISSLEPLFPNVCES